MKWATFCRPYFHMHFIDRFVLHFHSNSFDFPYRSDSQKNNTGLGNDLVYSLKFTVIFVIHVNFPTHTWSFSCAPPNLVINKPMFTLTQTSEHSFDIKDCLSRDSRNPLITSSMGGHEIQSCYRSILIK